MARSYSAAEQDGNQTGRNSVTKEEITMLSKEGVGRTTEGTGGFGIEGYGFVCKEGWGYQPKPITPWPVEEGVMI